MKCPYCCCVESRVVDSHQSEDGSSIRRRRECENCKRRFTTYERVDMVPLIVVKKDQTRETFDVNKLRSGIIKACEKRPVPLEEIEKLVRENLEKLNPAPRGREKPVPSPVEIPIEAAAKVSATAAKAKIDISVDD